MDNSKLRDSVEVATLARNGVPWAKKLQSNGWNALRTNQKAAARAALRLPNAPVAARVTTPRILNGNPSRAPRARNQPGRAAKTSTFTKSEYVANVIPTQATTGIFDSWVINPRDVRSFPQLSLNTAQYERYKITNFRVRYSSKCNEFTNGGIIIAFTSDSSDPVPRTKYDLMNLQCRAEGSVRNNWTLTCTPDTKVRYLRDSSADDPKLVDYGRVHLCTYGQNATDPAVLGELFFEYTVVLSEPQYNQTVTQSQLSIAAPITGPGFVSVTNTTTALTFTFNAAGDYLLQVIVTTPQGGPTFTNATNQSVKAFSDTNSSYTVTFHADSPGATVIWTQTTAAASLEWYCSRL